MFCFCGLEDERLLSVSEQSLNVLFFVFSSFFRAPSSDDSFSFLYFALVYAYCADNPIPLATVTSSISSRPTRPRRSQHACFPGDIIHLMAPVHPISAPHHFLHMRAVFHDLVGAVALVGTCKGVRDDEMAGLDREGAYWLEYQPAGYEWSVRG